MRLSDKWQDYCLIDTSDGERLERWGDVTLIRPDPQIIWKCSGEAPEWRTAHAKYNRSSSGGGSWDYRRKLPESFALVRAQSTMPFTASTWHTEAPAAAHASVAPPV